MTDWLLKLVNGTLIIGTVEDDQADSMITVTNPRRLKVPFSFAESNNTFLDESQYIENSTIYIPRTAILFWAKPTNSAYRR